MVLQLVVEVSKTGLSHTAIVQPNLSAAVGHAGGSLSQTNPRPKPRPRRPASVDCSVLPRLPPMRPWPPRHRRQQHRRCPASCVCVCVSRAPDAEAWYRGKKLRRVGFVDSIPRYIEPLSLIAVRRQRAKVRKAPNSGPGRRRLCCTTNSWAAPATCLLLASTHPSSHPFIHPNRRADGPTGPLCVAGVVSSRTLCTARGEAVGGWCFLLSLLLPACCSFGGVLFACDRTGVSDKQEQAGTERVADESRQPKPSFGFGFGSSRVQVEVVAYCLLLPRHSRWWCLRSSCAALGLSTTQGRRRG